jgi:hypothetical protein
MSNPFCIDVQTKSNHSSTFFVCCTSTSCRTAPDSKSNSHFEPLKSTNCFASAMPPPIFTRPSMNDRNADVSSPHCLPMMCTSSQSNVFSFLAACNDRTVYNRHKQSNILLQRNTCGTSEADRNDVESLRFLVGDQRYATREPARYDDEPLVRRRC